MADELVLASYRALGVDPKMVQGSAQITPVLKTIAKTTRRKNNIGAWMEMLCCSTDPDAVKILEAYESILRKDAKKLPMEAFCRAANVDPFRCLEIITASVVRTSAQASTIIAAVQHPAVVQKTVDMALTNEGFADRQTLHKATGFLPMPKGNQTNITIAQNQSHTTQVMNAPSPEASIRRLADRFNKAKSITPVATVITEEENDDAD